jgi:hypothetical protein
MLSGAHQTREVMKNGGGERKETTGESRLLDLLNVSVDSSVKNGVGLLTWQGNTTVKESGILQGDEGERYLVSE